MQISPEDLEKPSADAIEDNLNAKYSNKVPIHSHLMIAEIGLAASKIRLQVIQKIGLCICVYDILTASDGLIGHGTGVINVNGRLVAKQLYGLISGTLTALS